MEPKHIGNFLETGLVKQEQAKPELTRQKTSEDFALETALKSPLIIKSSLEELKQVLRLVMMKIGLRGQNFPTTEEKAVLIDHILTNFGGHSLQEIRLAFDMALAGKLDVDDARCYENFSCAYFSTIMNGYRKWSEEAYRALKMDQPPIQKIFTQEELDDSAREDAERQYQNFLRGLEVKSLSINKAILEKDNLLNNGESVMDFFKRRVASGSANIYIKK